MIGFRTIYTAEPLPTGAPVLLYDSHGEIVMVVHEPSLHEDPQGVMDTVSAHCHSNVVGHMAELALRLAG